MHAALKNLHCSDWENKQTQHKWSPDLWMVLIKTDLSPRQWMTLCKVKWGESSPGMRFISLADYCHVGLIPKSPQLGFPCTGFNPDSLQWDTGAISQQQTHVVKIKEVSEYFWPDPTSAVEWLLVSVGTDHNFTQDSSSRHKWTVLKWFSLHCRLFFPRKK